MAFVKASWGGRGEVLKNYPASAGDSRHSGSIPGSGSFHREANGNPLQYSCWRVPWTEQPSGLHTVHGVTKSWTQLSDSTHSLCEFSSVQFSSVTQSCPTLRDPMNRSIPGLPVHHQLPEFTKTHVHRVSDSSHLILCRPLLLLPPIPPSIRVFSNESTLR